jgi:hypothetical protein
MAIRHDPRGAWNYDQFGGLALALLVLGRDEKSIVWLQRALAAVRHSYLSLRAHYHVALAAASA